MLVGYLRRLLLACSVIVLNSLPIFLFVHCITVFSYHIILDTAVGMFISKTQPRALIPTVVLVLGERGRRKGRMFPLRQPNRCILFMQLEHFIWSKIHNSFSQKNLCARLITAHTVDTSQYITVVNIHRLIQ